MIKFKKAKASSVGKIPFDAYITPSGLPDAIVAWLSTLGIKPGRVVEPSVGTGAFARAAKAVWLNAAIYGVDIRPECEKLCADVLDGFWAGDWEDIAPILVTDYRMLILGNPPFSKAAQHIRQALDILKTGDHLAFLLRVGFLGSYKRAKNFWPNTPGMRWFRAIAPRPSFAFDGNDNSEYAMYVFEKGYDGPCELIEEPLIWRDDVEDAA